MKARGTLGNGPRIGRLHCDLLFNVIRFVSLRAEDPVESITIAAKFRRPKGEVTEDSRLPTLSYYAYFFSLYDFGWQANELVKW